MCLSGNAVYHDGAHNDTVFLVIFKIFKKYTKHVPHKKGGGLCALALHMKNYLMLKKLDISQLFPSFLEKESHGLI